MKILTKKIKLTVKKNPKLSQRQAVITFSGKDGCTGTLTVRQGASQDIRVELKPSNATVGWEKNDNVVISATCANSRITDYSVILMNEDLGSLATTQISDTAMTITYTNKLDNRTKENIENKVTIKYDYDDSIKAESIVTQKGKYKDNEMSIINEDEWSHPFDNGSIDAYVKDEDEYYVSVGGDGLEFVTAASTSHSSNVNLKVTRGQIDDCFVIATQGEVSDDNNAVTFPIYAVSNTGDTSKVYTTEFEYLDPVKFTETGIKCTYTMKQGWGGLEAVHQPEVLPANEFFYDEETREGDYYIIVKPLRVIDKELTCTAKCTSNSKVPSAHIEVSKKYNIEDPVTGEASFKFLIKGSTNRYSEVLDFDFDFTYEGNDGPSLTVKISQEAY